VTLLRNNESKNIVLVHQSGIPINEVQLYFCSHWGQLDNFLGHPHLW
jgi:hypothetical protein